MREINEIEWEATMERCLRRIGRSAEEVSRERKSAEWKVAIAAFMKRRTNVSNPWLGEHMNMGAPAAVSRYVGGFMRDRPRANSDYLELLLMESEDLLNGSSAEELPPVRERVLL